MDDNKIKTVTDMHADGMLLIKTWSLVRCNCYVHNWRSAAIVLTSFLVVEHRRHNCGSGESVTYIPAGSPKTATDMMQVSCNCFKHACW